jgi:hypothetical protein
MTLHVIKITNAKYLPISLSGSDKNSIYIHL